MNKQTTYTSYSKFYHTTGRKDNLIPEYLSFALKDKSSAKPINYAKHFKK